MTAAGIDTVHQAAVESFLYEWVTEFDVPGAAVAIVTPDDETMAAAVGARHLRSNAPVTPDTLSAVGSVTKSFTATAIMQQVEAGFIELTDSPAGYTDAAFDGVEDVTIHELLSHSSGMPSLAVSEGLIAQQTDQADPPNPIGDRDDFYRYLNAAGDELLDADRFLYCNSGYMLLADIVREVTGRPFHEVVTADILDPLGMERSTMNAGAFEADPDSMTPYRRADGGGRWQAATMPIRELSRGPGGLFTSVRELGSYLRMYLNDGVADDGTQILLSDSIEQMIGAHIETPAGPYGYGWRTVELDGNSLVGHGGSVGVSTAYAGWSTELGLGIAVVCNAAPGHGLAVLGEGVLLTALGEDPNVAHQFFSRYHRQQSLIGRYESYRGSRTAIVDESGGLLRLTLDEPLPLAPRSLIFEGETDGGYQYWTVGDRGRIPVDFLVVGDEVELRFDRWRMDRVGTH